MNYITTDAELTSVADAIRTRGGTSESLVYPSGFITAIESLGQIVPYSSFADYADIEREWLEGTLSFALSLSSFRYYTSHYSYWSFVSEGVFAGLSKITGASFGSCKYINGSAFALCRELRFASFPICTSIYQSAFSGCSKLETLYFPSCNWLANNAFRDCTSLKEVSFTYVLSFIGSSAFENCTGLEKATFGIATSSSSYLTIFSGCTSLKEVNFPNYTGSLYGGIFQSLPALQVVNIPKCKGISDYTFADCVSLSEVTSFPNVTNHLGQYAFSGCTSLRKVYLENCPIVLGHAFDGCTSLEDVSLPKCSSIRNSAFMSCYALSEIYLPRCKRMDTSTFYDCPALKSVRLPVIGVEEALSAIFYLSTKNIEFVSIPRAVSTSDYMSVFRLQSMLTSVYCPFLATTGKSTFQNCESLSKISVPSLSLIGQNTFASCSSLSIISLPKVDVISAGAFYMCINLHTAILRSGSLLSGEVFLSCSNLSSLYLLGSSYVSLYSSTSWVFGGTKILQGLSGKVYVPASLYNGYRSSLYWSAISGKIASLTSSQIEDIIDQERIADYVAYDYEDVLGGIGTYSMSTPAIYSDMCRWMSRGYSYDMYDSENDYTLHIANTDYQYSNGRWRFTGDYFSGRSGALYEMVDNGTNTIDLNYDGGPLGRVAVFTFYEYDSSDYGTYVFQADSADTDNLLRSWISSGKLFSILIGGTSQVMTVASSEDMWCDDSNTDPYDRTKYGAYFEDQVIPGHGTTTYTFTLSGADSDCFMLMLPDPTGEGNWYS